MERTRVAVLETLAESDLLPDYRDGLLLLAHQTDIVIVPIADGYVALEPTTTGWRGLLISSLRRYLIVL